MGRTLAGAPEHFSPVSTSILTSGTLRRLVEIFEIVPSLHVYDKGHGDELLEVAFLSQSCKAEKVASTCAWCERLFSWIASVVPMEHSRCW